MDLTVVRPTLMSSPTCQPVLQCEPRGDFIYAKLATDIGVCELCRGSGLQRNTVQENGRTYDTVLPCVAKKLQQRCEIVNAAQLPAVHVKSTFATYKFASSQQQHARLLMEKLAFQWPQNKGVILAGPVGTGKTHLLVAALRHLSLEHSVRVAYVELSLLYAQIRRGFQDGKSGGEIIGPLSQIEVLAIDELGKGRGSAFELETLDELIARRYNAGKVTLFATNYSLKAPEEKLQRGIVSTADLLDAGKDSRLLCDRVGDRIYSRLIAMCDFVEFPFSTPDHRKNPLR
jgi:DNA replication protein DnaC